LFPDAAYPLVSGATGLRGRVMRGGSPMRWALVEAIVPGSTPELVVARTRGNDRGEFLLVLPSAAVPGAELPAQVTLRVAVSGPAGAPVPANDELPALDPLWDLPLEPLAADSTPDPVADGSQPPVGYQRSATTARDVNFQLGRILTGVDEADFQFTPA
jgi:hypothetical protein